jgi:nucleotide-binding universal stress UspA family protein
MNFTKKVIVAVGLSNDMATMLKPLHNMDFLSVSEVHFVHVFNTMNYTTVFSDFPIVYPVETDLKGIDESVLAFLVKTSKEVLPTGFMGKVLHKCFFDPSPKDKFCDYVKETNADLVIVPTREKRGVFESSFAQYVNKHTKSNMIILKKY